jgi:molybdopterin molybdotransferase
MTILNGLLSVGEALQRLLKVFSPVELEELPLDQAVGRVLARPVRSSLDLPRFNNSSMDGFAVRAADVATASDTEPVVLPVMGDIPAGANVSFTLKNGHAVRIMTGAPLPQGSDAVVPVEWTDHNSRQVGTAVPHSVKLFKSVQIGDYVRPIGQDVITGETVLEAGVRLRPQEAGFLAMLGISRVGVYRMPRVAVFSSGDELLPAGADLEPGKIYDANTTMLVAQIKKYGGQAISLGVIPDRLEAVRECLDKGAATKVDLILSSAGVSVGAFDYVRPVVEENGRLDFWRVNMRPGKPVAFGNYRGIPFIGLPGNPVSAFVGFEVFVRPVLLKLSGRSRVRESLKVLLDEPIESDGRESYLRAVVRNENGRWRARLTGHQGSGNLRSLVQANALLLVPSEVKSLPAETEIDAWLFDE